MTLYQVSMMAHTIYYVEGTLTFSLFYAVSDTTVWRHIPSPKWPTYLARARNIDYFLVKNQDVSEVLDFFW